MRQPPKGSAYTLIYAALLGVVCATVLTAAHRVLGPMQQAHQKGRTTQQVLAALRVPGAAKVSGEAAEDLLAAKVTREEYDGETVYKYLEDKGLRVIALRFEGPGYLGPIAGYVSLEADWTTIRAVVITECSESPGLGGQLVTEEYLAKYRGKTIDALTLVREPRASQTSEVDAVTGASITTKRFQAILDDVGERVRRLRRETP